MPSTSLILHRRQQRLAKSRKSPLGGFGFILALFASLTAACAAILLTAGYLTISSNLPPIETIETLIGPPGEEFLTPTRVYDRTGDKLLLTLENPGAAGHEYLPITKSLGAHIPASAITATLAAADPSFWQHAGFSLSGLSQPASPTLAERLVSNLLLWDEPPGVRRTMRTRLLAAQLTAKYGRPQILEWYLNTANYGRLAYGIDAAARVYFGKPAEDLTLAEAAVLAAIPDAPAINPLDTPSASLERGQAVLDEIERLGLASAAEVSAARQASLAFAPPAAWTSQPAPDFVQLALNQLARQFGWGRLERGGLRITTTLDADLQAQTSCALRLQFAQLTGQSENQLSQEECTAARLLPSISLPETFEPDDLAANAAVYAPDTGQLLALTIDAPENFETAISSGRPPGTLLTPFVYLTGFARGQSPGSLVWDIPGLEGSLLAETPNLDGTYQGPLRLRSALANDDLSPAVQSFFQAGSENVWRTARQLGMVSLGLADPQNSVETLWDGGSATLIELLQAYGTIANNGVLVGQTGEPGETQGLQALEPVTVLRVENSRGEILLDHTSPEFRPVVSPQLAYLLTDSLGDESARWRSLGHPNPLEIGRPAAVKMGQTLSGRNGWTIGYTPNVAAGVWMGSATEHDPAVLPRASAALWHAILQYQANQNQAAAGWEIPPGITTLEVCDPSGMLPTADCPTVVTEVFAAGNEPNQPDSLYRSLEINRESGLLATINTPPELVEKRVYLMVPPEAESWARQAGLPVPPEDYDLILSAENSSPDLRITAPDNFGYAREIVDVIGTAAGANFDFYRLQAGQGLNPQSWIQIGSDNPRPVRSGTLGEWDTQGLEGLYVIQLVKVLKDQRIETTSIQVTVDNQPPDGQILFPEADQVFEYPREEPLLFQVSAGDNLGINQVEFQVDQQPIGAVSTPPFTLDWTARPGDHLLTVRVVDLAGNVTTLEREFSVTR